MTNLGILLSCVFDGGFFYRVYYYRVFFMGFFFYREYEMYRPRAHLRKGALRPSYSSSYFAGSNKESI